MEGNLKKSALPKQDAFTIVTEMFLFSFGFRLSLISA